MSPIDSAERRIEQRRKEIAASNRWFYFWCVISLTPPLAGIIDFACLFFTSEACTNIPWMTQQGWRIAFAIIWPFLIFIAALMLST